MNFTMTTSVENITESPNILSNQEKLDQGSANKSNFTARDLIALDNAKDWDEFLLIKAAEDNCLFTRFLDRNNFLTEKERDRIYDIEVSRQQNYARAFGGIVQIVCKYSSTVPTEVSIASASSGEKQFFRDTNKVLSNTLWNQRGLHVLRVIFAWYIHQENTKKAISTTSYQLSEHGVATIENFVPKDCIKALKREIRSFPKGPVHKVSGTNIISEFTGKEFPYLRGISGNIANVVLKVIGREKDPQAIQLHDKNLFVQRVVNEPNDNDIQKTFHSDVFFPAIKYWWFPREVQASGAFEYGVLSPRLTSEVLDWHYKQSISATLGNYESWRGDGHREGSFRVSEEEMKSMGVTPKTFTVPANTLVIANVFGFHRRGHTDKEVLRDAVHGSIRVNNPFKLMNDE